MKEIMAAMKKEAKTGVKADGTKSDIKNEIEME